MPFLKAAAVHDDVAGTLTLFLLNRNLEDAMTVDVAGEGFAGLAIGRAATLRHDDLEAANTRDAPERVARRPLSDVSLAGGIRIALPPASWNVVQLRTA